ncbi:MAG: hypothetical protein KBT05_07905 [Bacteroidales bacterium]|nr:hypothetical protein [Candidatus Cryptobacteroides caccocaballi]
MYNLLSANPSFFQLNQDLIIVVCVCVILPVSVVALIVWSARNNTNRKAEIMTKAIEAGVSIPEDFWDRMGGKSEKAGKLGEGTIKAKLLRSLRSGVILSGIGIILTVTSIATFSNDFFTLSGLILLVVGIGNIVYYIVASKSLADRIQAEEEVEIAKILKKKDN